MPLAIKTAVVLALPVPGADPLEPLAGLPLALRAVLTLQKEGFERIHIVVEQGDSRTGARISADPRVRVPVELLPAASACDALATLCRAGGPLLVARAEAIVAPSIYGALASAPLGGLLALVAAKRDEPIGPFVASPDLADPLARRGQDARLDQILGELVAVGTAGRFDIDVRWAHRVDTAAGKRAAIDALFEACRKPVDGIVSRHLNRHVSIFISKHLVATPITPNMTSIATFLLAIGAAISVARGGYGPMLLGAALFQANSILDGVDGELARVRFQHSKLGQWLDTVFDDASTALFYAGLTVGVRDFAFGAALATCGYLAIAALALTVVQYYAELLLLGSGDFYALDWQLTRGAKIDLWTKIARFFQLLLKKDFFILLYLALALVGLLPLALAVALFGHVLALGAATTRNARRLLPRA